MSVEIIELPDKWQIERISYLYGSDKQSFIDLSHKCQAYESFKIRYNKCPRCETPVPDSINIIYHLMK